MIKRRNGIVVESNVPRHKRVHARKPNYAGFAKFHPEYVDLYRFEEGQRISVVMPYKKKIVEQYVAEGWKIAERYKRPVFSLVEGV